MSTTRRDFTAGAAILFPIAGCATTPPSAPPPNTVNDITQLNPIAVQRIAEPRTQEELAALVASHPGPISIGGGRFSQGGQIATPGALFVDMRQLNRILAIDQDALTLRVEAGATWRQIQEALDPHDLSVKIMQSFFNFTVGGSLSVNCHGDYVGLGPIVETVRAIRLVLANGTTATAGREQNRDLFDAAIGGYGGVGVIAEATLDLARNARLERVTRRMKVNDYPAWHAAQIEARDDVILHHAVIYPGAYEDVAAEVSSLTDKPLTITDRLAPQGEPSALQRFLLALVTFTPFGQSLHEHVYDPMTDGRTEIVWRNYEAARDVYSLEPTSRVRSTYVLQEYFVPTDRFEAFAASMARILRAHDANVLNVAIRHARADAETLLSWAKSDVFSFVLYYQQGTSEAAQAEVGTWTRELAEAALAEGGSFYLPYQIHATRAQFLAAYPRADAYFALKRRIDPSTKFRNRLWDAYFV